MRDFVLRALSLAAFLPLTVGCVSYSAYKGVQAELERTRDANRHLVDQYNRAVLEGKRAREGQGMTIAGVDPEAYRDLQARFAALQDQMRGARATDVAIDKADVDAIDGAEYEEGGIRLGEELLFNSGEAKLKSSQLPVLDQIADLLERRYAGQSIIVEGHTDNVPLVKTLGLFQYNVNLGYQRAYHVFQYLQSKHGIPENQFRLESFGFTKPVDPATADSDTGRRTNRRVVIRLSGHRI